MNKNTKKILTLSVLSLFMFAFAMTLVVAENAPAVPAVPATVGGSSTSDGLFVTLWDAFFGGMSFGDGGFFTGLLEKMGIGGTEGMDFPTLLSFFLLMFIVFLLIYDITDLLPFLSEGWMTWAFSIAFTILAFISFDIEQIGYLTSTYQAVGITLLAIVPFIVIATFVWKLDRRAEAETKPSYQMFGSAIWIGFGVYLLLKLVEMNNATQFSASSPIAVSYLVMTVIALGAVFMHSKIFRWFNKGTLKKLRGMGIRKGEANQIRKLRLKINDLQASIDLPENASDAKLIKRRKEEIARLEQSIEILQD